jgi:hypothetical protein
VIDEDPNSAEVTNEESKSETSSRKKTSGTIAERGGSGMIYTIGVSLNNPRSCIRSAPMAEDVDFLMVHIDGLTEHTYGCTKEESKKFFPKYYRHRIYSVSMIKIFYTVIAYPC